MDNKLIHFYNQNRWLCITILITVIAVIVLIHILNTFIANNSESAPSINEFSFTTTQDKQNYFAISDKKTELSNSQIIYDFIGFCNNKEPEKAYDLLSDECKNILYTSIEKFIQNYYNRIFKTKKTFEIQALISNGSCNTYQVRFAEDILSTGNASGSNIIDYYTIIGNERRKQAKYK